MTRARCSALATAGTLLACLIAGGCATQAPAPPVEVASIPLPPATPTPARKPTPVQRRGGGYYKDDGPGDNPPENLDQVPDAIPRAEPLIRAPNRPYSVFGRDYVPDRELRPYRARGIASWYGRKFHGERTSSGETYDMYAMTAAHPTLPIPSYVRVTNLENSRSVVLRVNDRGPFHEGRIIDLTYAAAYRLGYADRGSAPVEIETIIPGDESNLAGTTRPSDDAPRLAANSSAAEASDAYDPIGSFAARPNAARELPAILARRSLFLQLAAFENRENAEAFGEHLKREVSWAADRLVLVADSGKYKLQVGPLASDDEARSIAARLAASLGFKPFVIRRN